MSDIKNLIDHIPDDMSRVVIDRMIMLGARLRPEEALHFPSYFRSEPYIRVSLQRCFFKSEVDEECHEGAIEVSLMLNHSGIGILTLSVDLAEELSFEMAQKAMSPKWLLLGDVSLSQPLVEAGLTWRQRRRGRFKWEESSRAEGVLWRTFAAADGQNGFFVSDVFKTYVDAVCGAVGQSLRHEWHVHPILSLGKPLCACSENEFTVTHRDHLTALVRRTASDGKYAPAVHDTALLNVLPTTDVALYISSATAILIDYEAESADFMRDMVHAVTPIESALSQHAQLRQIDILTNATQIRDRNLFTAQRLLTTGLTEYQRDIYANETMQLVVDAVLERRRTAQLYSRLLDRVRSLEALVTSNYSRTQNRRSLGLSIAGFCVVLLLLLPRIAEAYDAFGRMGRWPSNVVSDVNGFTGGREATILILYLLVAVSAVAALASISVRWRRPRRRRRFGHSLEGKFSLELADGRANPPTRRDQIASLADGSNQDQ
ncbi:hypothetical protein [Williamsia sp.]|uniref:hypothetical protein n=1 Tax=Williamsia sp. TaxID=1872085 RepID=UPI001A2EACF9|nr:hypothetical protein [Williamsia sp.]MBJ7287589.1 hypothetical protein [Williamsia sp.]